MEPSSANQRLGLLQAVVVVLQVVVPPFQAGPLLRALHLVRGQLCLGHGGQLVPELGLDVHDAAAGEDVPARAALPDTGQEAQTDVGLGDVVRGHPRAAGDAEGRQPGGSLDSRHGVPGFIIPGVLGEGRGPLAVLTFAVAELSTPSPGGSSSRTQAGQHTLEHA